MKIKTIKKNQAHGKKKRPEFLVTWQDGAEIKSVSFYDHKYVINMLTTLENDSNASNLKIYRKIV